MLKKKVAAIIGVVLAVVISIGMFSMVANAATTVEKTTAETAVVTTEMVGPVPIAKKVIFAYMVGGAMVFAVVGGIVVGTVRKVEDRLSED